MKQDITVTFTAFTIFGGNYIMNEIFYNDSLFIKYRVSLAGLCHCCVSLALLKEKMMNGETIEKEDIKKMCDKLAFHKKELLDAKKELGFDDGLSFMENNHFQGFEIKDGCLIGNPDLAFVILRPWYEGFPVERKINNYEFEVANYLLTFLVEQEKLKEEKNEVDTNKKSSCKFYDLFMFKIKSVSKWIRKYLYD